jgi:hypothetical protein
MWLQITFKIKVCWIRDGNKLTNDVSMQQDAEIYSVVSVCKRTISTERPQSVGEVSANFSW